MQNIFTELEHLVHQVTIHHGPGLTVDPARTQESHDWVTIERQLNAIDRSGSIVVDYWQDDAKHEHPLLNGWEVVGFTLAIEDNDRLHRATIYPIPGTVRLDNYQRPQSIRLAASRFELLIKRDNQRWNPSIAANLRINPQTGRIVIM